jgi:hypothetical protein
MSGYCVIDGYPVLLTDERWERLLQEVGKEKGWEWRIGARIRGSWGCSADVPIYELLNRYYKESPWRFGEEWIKFDFHGDEAARVLFDVLAAYCEWFGHCTVSERQLSSMEHDAIASGDALLEPSGSVLALSHVMKPWHWWWRYRHGMKNRAVVLNIDASKVRRIRGAIHRFYILYGDIPISFAEDIEVGSFVPELLRRELEDNSRRRGVGVADGWRAW